MPARIIWLKVAQGGIWLKVSRGGEKKTRQGRTFNRGEEKKNRRLLLLLLLLPLQELRTRFFHSQGVWRLLESRRLRQALLSRPFPGACALFGCLRVSRAGGWAGSRRRVLGVVSNSSPVSGLSEASGARCSLVEVSQESLKNFKAS